MRRASLVGVLALTAVLAGCSAPAPVPGGSDSAPTAAAGAPSSSPAATQSPTAADFAVPSTCDGLLPPELAASFASQGLTGSEVAVFGDVAVGDPIPVLDYDTNADSGIVMADYLFCDWTGSDQTIDIFLGRVDATSRPLVVSEFWSFDRRIDRTAATVVMTFDGMIPGVGQGPANYWALRTNSELKVDVSPGDEQARQLAQSIADQVAAHVMAD